MPLSINLIQITSPFLEFLREVVNTSITHLSWFCTAIFLVRPKRLFFFVDIKYHVKHVSKIDASKGKNVALCEKNRQWKTGFRRIEILRIYWLRMGLFSHTSNESISITMILMALIGSLRRHGKVECFFGYSVTESGTVRMLCILDVYS